MYNIKYVQYGIMLGVCTAFVVAIAAGTAVFAQTGEGVRVEPAIVEERVEPGETFSSSIRITNFRTVAVTYGIAIRDIASVTEGQPIYAEIGEATDRGVSTWVTLEQNTITIEAGETAIAKFSITVPPDAAPGGHFGGIFVILEAERLQETGAGIGFQVGSILNFRVGGDIEESAQIREFRADKSVYSEPLVTFTTRVRNTGNVLIRPRGPVDIVNFFGKKVATLTMNDEAGGVFPEGEREFEISWQSQDLAFGRYQAFMALTYGEEGRKTIDGTVTFWVLPLRLLVSVLGGILIFVVGITLLIRAMVRRRLHALGIADENLPRSQATLPFGNLLFVTGIILLASFALLTLLFFLFG